MLYIIEEEKPIAELITVLLAERYDFQFIPFKELLLQAESIMQKKNEIVVDISRNPNYLLIVNRIKKLFDCLVPVNFIVNSEQYKLLNNDSMYAENVAVVRSVADLESFFNTKLKNCRRQL